MKKIATFTENEEFEPEKVGIVSLAAKSLCMWVIAIEKYGKVWRVVGPKKARLEETLDSLRKKQAELAELQGKLKDLQDFVNKLKKEYDEKTKEMVIVQSNDQFDWRSFDQLRYCLQSFRTIFKRKQNSCNSNFREPPCWLTV